MLGQAHELKTWYVENDANENIDAAINRVLELLGDREVVSINYQKSQNVDSALIIYKLAVIGINSDSAR
ncbi:hypothetical protein M5X04_14615 [Paenibacillus alvei]|uniref:Uncharacterized protein n=1 Tax=Paenibacillus alvei TaxID=44250 RepID=A0ABT4E9Z6_PAEAL|nr:hypothetical protein [Paenibacillus alvei]MCY9530552.1 hypothetical protein [Paenibacillus alvei]